MATKIPLKEAKARVLAYMQERYADFLKDPDPTGWWRNRWTPEEISEGSRLSADRTAAALKVLGREGLVKKHYDTSRTPGRPWEIRCTGEVSWLPTGEGLGPELLAAWHAKFEEGLGEGRPISEFLQGAMDRVEGRPAGTPREKNPAPASDLVGRLKF